MTSALVLLAAVGLFPLLVKLGVDIVHKVESNQHKAHVHKTEDPIRPLHT